MYVRIGLKNREKILDVKEITSAICENVGLALPALCTFTSIDYTYAFYGIGKGKTFIHFLFDTIDEFVCKLYSVPNCANTDDARYKKFVSVKILLSVKSCL